MPFYYVTAVTGTTTSGSAPGELDHLRFLTSATRTCAFVQVIASARMSAVGGGTLRLRRFTTPSTNQTAITPNPKDPGAPVATVTASTNPTAGTTVTNLMSIGFSQTGAQGFWGAAEPNDAVILAPGGSGPGNMDVFSICNTASVLMDITTEHIE